MRGVKGWMLITLGFAEAACARPIFLKIDVPIPRPAQVSLRPLISRIGTADPDQTCQTPCSVKVTSEVAYELTVRAQGYYPVHIERLTYDQVRSAKPAILVVPMQKRLVRQEAVVPFPE